MSYTLSRSDDDSFQNVYGDRYGFFKEEYPGLADRRHRLVVSGIVQLPWGLQISAIGDFRSSLPMNPTSSIDINADGYAIDLPAGVTRFSGCRDLNLDGDQHLPAGPGDCRRSATSRALVSPTSMCASPSRCSCGGSQELELIGQLFNLADRANYNVPNNNITAATFGQSTSLLPNINAPSRQVEVALRYRF